MLKEEAEKRRWNSKDYSDELNKNEIRLDSEIINSRTENLQNDGSYNVIWWRRDLC